MPERGSIHWADLEPKKGHEQAGHRPVLIVSRTSFNQASGTAIVFPSRAKRNAWSTRSPRRCLRAS